MNEEYRPAFLDDPVSAALSPTLETPPSAPMPVEEDLNHERNIDDAEDLQSDAFSYDGYQVVRGEFFAHLNEPSIAFNRCKVSVNAACLKKLPEVNFVQILINADERKLAVRPCEEDEKDSFRWCTSGNGKRKPKQITCKVFFAKLFQLMAWNPDYRYKLLGKLVRSQDEYLFAFDLSAPEVYQRITENGASKASRSPTYPAEWQNQFGVDVAEHKKSLQINIFDGYAVFDIKEMTGTSPDRAGAHQVSEPQGEAQHE
jgi:hypothetical protein